MLPSQLPSVTQDQTLGHKGQMPQSPSTALLVSRNSDRKTVPTTPPTSKPCGSASLWQHLMHSSCKGVCVCGVWHSGLRRTEGTSEGKRMDAESLCTVPAQITRQEFAVTSSRGVGRPSSLFSRHSEKVGSLISPAHPLVYFSCHCFATSRAIDHPVNLWASVG